MFRKFGKIMAAMFVAAFVLAGFGASLAQASTPGSTGQATATVTVQESLGVSGFPTTVPFGAASPGTTVTATMSAYLISSNDPAGYSVSVTPMPDADISSGSNVMLFGSKISNSISDSALSVNGTAFSAANDAQHGTGIPITVHTSSVPSVGAGDSYTDVWALNVPPSAPVDSYSQIFDYTLAGN
jgi:hypothetical protein